MSQGTSTNFLARAKTGKIRVVGLVIIAGLLLVLMPLSRLLSPEPHYPYYSSETVFYPALIYAYSGWWAIGTGILALVLFGIWVYISAIRRYKGAWIVIISGCVFICVVSCYFCTETVFLGLEYHGSVRVDERLYQLTSVEIFNLDICNDEFWIVYECDSAGLLCHATFSSNKLCLGSTESEQAQRNASLHFDSTINQLYLQRGAHNIPLEDKVSKIPAAPAPLSQP